MKVVIFDDDVDMLRPICDEWAKSVNNVSFDMAFDEDAYLEWLDDMSRTGDILVLTDGLNLLGFIVMSKLRSMISYDSIALESSWYVLEEHRQFGTLRLLKAAIQWGKDNDCVHVMFNASNLASGMHDKVCSLYERIGMKKLDTGYIASI